MTNACNLSYHHCYASALHRGKHARFMDLVRILSKLDSAGATHLAITGGEPFLHPELERIIRYIYLSTKLNFTVLTNGAIFREEVINLLSKVREVGGLFISLDDVDSENHNEFRGTPGAWEQTGESIRLTKPKSHL
ncbi:radical SAM protein [Thermococcus piezophilus]|nr:radical SAM protein [Thermococcus piezophilus]